MHVKYAFIFYLSIHSSHRGAVNDEKFGTNCSVRVLVPFWQLQNALEKYLFHVSSTKFQSASSRWRYTSLACINIKSGLNRWSVEVLMDLFLFFFFSGGSTASCRISTFSSLCCTVPWMAPKRSAMLCCTPRCSFQDWTTPGWVGPSTNRTQASKFTAHISRLRFLTMCQ